MMIVGNIVFMRELGDDGVAAFSVACYCLPIVFMLSNAVAQSVQPIISYNLGAGMMRRVNGAMKISVVAAVVCGIGAVLVMLAFKNSIIELFLGGTGRAYDIASRGLPVFISGYVFFAFNIVAVGYYQSIERANRAMVYTLLRGFVFMIAAFAIMPVMLGEVGIWIAVPCSELATSTVIAVCYLFDKRKVG